MMHDLEELYKDLHAHPELAFTETRTAGIVAERLRAAGFDVVTAIAVTGVVGVLRNGDGATVLLRADMDALPVREETGLEYASEASGIDSDGERVPVMHACGHDMHVACLLGAAERLAADRDSWSGTLVALFQPAEEHGGGAQRMLDDGLYEKVPRPDVVLGQHVSPHPAGMLGAHPGPAFAATDAFTVRLIGRGGHGSRPETTVDPVVMAAATVLRLQGVVSREVAGGESAVVTVGRMQAGTKENIIPGDATLGISVRSYTEAVRDRVLAAVTRIIHAEAEASGAPEPPRIDATESYPVLVNDAEATARVMQAFREQFGEAAVLDPGPVTGSEDVGNLATAADAPLVYWLLGGGDPATVFAAMAAGTTDTALPSNHSPHFAPVIQPTLSSGIDALVTAARVWLT